LSTFSSSRKKITKQIAEQPPPKLAEASKVFANGWSGKWSSKPTEPIKQRLKKNLKISGHQQRWPRPLLWAILIPPALMVAADLEETT